MDPRPGGRYRYATEKGSIVVNNVSEFECHGEILEYDPPRVLVYTWIANWHDDSSPHGGPLGTHAASRRNAREGHPQRPRPEPIARKDYSGGWPGVVEQLKKFVEK